VRLLVESWEGAVADFLADCRRRNHTPATLAVYSSALLGPRISVFRADHGIKGLHDFTAERLRGLELELLDAGLSPGTVHQYHRTLKTFLLWCQSQGYAVDARTAQVQAPRRPQTEPATYTDAELRRLRAMARYPRDRFLVEFFLATGLRLAEVVAVALEDIVELPDRGVYIRIRQGKGRKDRLVPLDADFAKQLKAYIAKHHRQGCDRLFTNLRGIPAPLDREAVKSILDRLGEEANVHCHAHKFRHTMASRAIADGVDPITLQRVLGHTTLEMVARYVHYSAADLLDAWTVRRPQTRSRR
jgi:integrase/recombinase XerD